jgi:hypothetical protein
MKPSALCWLTACGLLLACGGQTGKTLPPIGQIKLYVATDAPLPAGPDKPVDPNEPPALFDRLRIDVFAPEASEACAGCSNEWELDRMGLEDASIGIVPPPGVGGYVARARLFRGITLKGGEPPQLSTIDVYVALPPVNREGISKRTIVLRVQDLGHPVGSLSEPGSTLEGDPCVALRGESCEAPPGQPAPPAILGLRRRALRAPALLVRAKLAFREVRFGWVTPTWASTTMVRTPPRRGSSS